MYGNICVYPQAYKNFEAKVFDITSTAFASIHFSQGHDHLHVRGVTEIVQFSINYYLNSIVRNNSPSPHNQSSYRGSDRNFSRATG